MSLCVTVMFCIELMLDSGDYEFYMSVIQVDLVKMQPRNHEKIGIRKLDQKEEWSLKYFHCFFGDYINHKAEKNLCTLISTEIRRESKLFSLVLRLKHCLNMELHIWVLIAEIRYTDFFKK